MNPHQDLMVKMALDSWNTQVSKGAKLFRQLTFDQLIKEVAPGRNTGVYLLGHLVAVHDDLHPLFNLGHTLHPELENIFIKNSDKSNLEKPAIKLLLHHWDEVHGALEKHFNSMTTDEWFQKHNSISEEDFRKEPNRNKLNVLLNRTNHLSYHLGQLAFLKEEED